MNKDIVKYVLGFLDGFAYHWFEALDKGNTPFCWKDFEAAFHTKFIPVQLSLKRYLAIKQNGHSVAEFLVEWESLENSLSDAIPDVLKDTSFHENIDGWLIKKLVTFHDLLYEEYKRKAESTDQDMRERKLVSYSMKKVSLDAPKKTMWNTDNKMSTKQIPPSGKKPNDQKLKMNTKQDELSKNQMKKDGVCFTCKKGHIAKNCPENEKLENNSIQVVLNTKLDKAIRIK